MPDPTPMAAAARYRQMLESQNNAAARRLIRAYELTWRDLLVRIEALEAQIAAAPQISAWQLQRMDRYQALLAQIEQEMGRYGVVVANEVSTSALDVVSLGLRNSRAMVLAGLSPDVVHAISTVWNSISVDAVMTMIGFLGPDSPLQVKLIQQLGPQIAQQVGDELLKAMALGLNPREAARAIQGIVRGQMGQGLTWALRTARTAQNYAYRTATHGSYLANSDIVSGWIWHASLDTRTCISCISQHGQRFPLTKSLNDHYNGRCAMVPVTVTWEAMGYKGIENAGADVALDAGQRWFNGLAQTDQRQIMGNAMWRAWKAGDVKWDDFVTTMPTDDYGDMRVAASLKGILGSKAKKYYR